MSTQPSMSLTEVHVKEKDMTTQTPTSRRLTRYLAVPALALGLALGSAAAANALPEWDIGAYDRCVARIPDDVLLSGNYTDAVHECCLKTGGIWDGTKSENSCGAPPAEQSGRNPLPSDAPTHVIQPLPLPGHGGDLGSTPGGVLTSSP
jgi:hypothetical protein